MTLPNLLTLLRLGLVPVVVLGLEWPGHTILALVGFAIASGTDWIDGYLARKLNQVTALGSLLDPLADKVLVTAALLGMVHLALIPAWSVTVVLSREFLITGLRTAAINKGIVLSASMSGKIKTVLQMAAIIALLVGWMPLGTALWWAAVAVTIYSGVEYLWQTRGIWV
jgi:CDP-diacylglycerol--glycerol-3-phosphate 3-phosphatidyltransferase